MHLFWGVFTEYEGVDPESVPADAQLRLVGNSWSLSKYIGPRGAMECTQTESGFGMGACASHRQLLLRRQGLRNLDAARMCFLQVSLYLEYRKGLNGYQFHSHILLLSPWYHTPQVYLKMMLAIAIMPIYQLDPLLLTRASALHPGIVTRMSSE